MSGVVCGQQWYVNQIFSYQIDLSSKQNKRDIMLTFESGKNLTLKGSTTTT